MGTRSLTHIYHVDGTTPMLSLYRQFDGYPSGHGALISKTFKGRKLVDGYSNPDTQVNGMANVPTMLIGAYYHGDPYGPIPCGGLYITGPGASDEGEEYVYHIRGKSGQLKLTVEQGYYPKFKVIFDGPLDDFNPLMQEEEDAA